MSVTSRLFGPIQHVGRGGTISSPTLYRESHLLPVPATVEFQ